MKSRAGLLSSLTQLHRSSHKYLARIGADAEHVLKSRNREELVKTSREIVRVQLNLMKLSRQLAAVASQIRAFVSGKEHCLIIPSGGNTKPVSRTGYLDPEDAGERFAFKAIVTESGATVVRVVADTSAVRPLEEYGCFETWTAAQDFATVLNQSCGIDPVEAQYIIVSASLARRLSKQEH